MIVFVDIPEEFISQIITESGIILHNDPSWDREGNKTTHGTVVAINPCKSSRPTLYTVEGRARTRRDRERLGDMAKEYELPTNIEVGDKIHFRYISNDKDRGVFLYEDDGSLSSRLYFPVRPKDIFAVERENGELDAQAGYVLIEPKVTKKIESKHIIIPDEFNDEEHRNIGTVVSVSEPLAGDPLDPMPRVGDEVVYRQYSRAGVPIVDTNDFNGRKLKVCFLSDVKAIL